MPAPGPPEFRRRAVDLARPRNKPIAPDRQDPGITGIMPARPDGPDRRRRGLVRELAALVMEMTRPAIAVSVIRAAATGLPASGDDGDPAGPARRPGRHCGRPAFPEEQHDGRITRRAPPDDVAVQSQAEGRRRVLSASGRRDLAGSRMGFAWLATGPGEEPYVSQRQWRTVLEDYSADGEGPGLPAARSREVARLRRSGTPGIIGSTVTVRCRAWICGFRPR